MNLDSFFSKSSTTMSFVVSSNHTNTLADQPFQTARMVLRYEEADITSSASKSPSRNPSTRPPSYAENFPLTAPAPAFPDTVTGLGGSTHTIPVLAPAVATPPPPLEASHGTARRDGYVALDFGYLDRIETARLCRQAQWERVESYMNALVGRVRQAGGRAKDTFIAFVALGVVLCMCLVAACLAAVAIGYGVAALVIAVDSGLQRLGLVGPHPVWTVG
ncbi:hypothetical protein K461DRAFT_168921 [Myriangium duriaei CBS 260.36]|uniref:Uncharacterized protein n=1 Tax=Myriangium duriaei CBS 260.36 TaxID=1168546 RepID=A0A9P4IYU7_9PEZI|nr:hypothetical protein K461DRAFT_168921 [Myriangium duriaei CBS 260.36]